MPPKTPKNSEKNVQKPAKNSTLSGKNVQKNGKFHLTKAAFLSVFDKRGIEKIATVLSQNGYHLLSTGGTKTYLQEKGFEVTESSEITGFGELLGGRVKSLHPTIFAGILAEREKADDPDYAMPELLIDTVVVNLYPFEKERDEQNFDRGSDPHHLLHFIDIGGSALIRAAAKNYPSVNVLCDASQYDGFVENLNAGNGETSEAFRKQLAVEAFQRSVSYDAAIASFLSSGATQAELPERATLPLVKIQNLRYGENPYQQAALYGCNTTAVDFEYLHGKELSFNNILDMEAAWRISCEFEEIAACAVIKHNNPCGVATSLKGIADAYALAFAADPLSAFGGVVATNRPIDSATAQAMKEVFLEVIIAPDFEPDAMEILTQKKNLRLIRRALPSDTLRLQTDIKQVNDALFLIQRAGADETVSIDKRLQQELSSIPTNAKPTEQQLQDLVFAWKVVKHVKSNAIVVAKNGCTLGIGGGQTSRIAAVEFALKHACDEAKDAVLASDGFFPATDNIQAAGLAKIAAIIQPGGSIKDSDVITACNEHNIAMVMTGLREFRH